MSFDAHALWRAVSILVLVWLAFFFGRTLRADKTPLIERIARISEPTLSTAMCRYTRQLTTIWCAYFVFSALLSLTISMSFGWTSALVWLGTVVLFVVEHRVRPYIFPSQNFPDLVQQIRDTWTVWRTDS